MLTDNLIYLDYQASTPIHESVLKAMKPYLKHEFANPHSTQHILGIKSNQAITDSQHKIAKLINADENEIIFTSGATEANNLALFGIANQNSKRKKILISSIEHKSVMAPAEHLINLGFDVEYIPVDSEGIINLDKYKEMLSTDVLIVSVIFVNNEIGAIQPIKEYARIAKSNGAIFHTDAAQAPLTTTIDVKELDIDLLSLSSHKMYGPKGVGALYIASHLQKNIQPMIFGGDQQNGLRSGTMPTHLCVGFGEAAEFVSTNKDLIFLQTKKNTEYFWKKISEQIKAMKLIGPKFENRHIGNLNIYFENIDADSLLGMLQTHVAASTGSACSSGSILPSYVLSAIGATNEEANSCIRFSFSYENTKSQLDKSIGKIAEYVNLLRSIN